MSSSFTLRIQESYDGFVMRDEFIMNRFDSESNCRVCSLTLVVAVNPHSLWGLTRARGIGELAEDCVCRSVWKDCIEINIFL